MMTESAKVDMIMQGLRTHDYVRVIDGLRPDSVFRFNPSEQPFLDLYIEDPNDFMRLLKLSIYKTLAEKRGNLQLITSGYKDLRVKIVSEDVIEGTSVTIAVSPLEKRTMSLTFKLSP